MYLLLQCANGLKGGLAWRFSISTTSSTSTKRTDASAWKEKKKKRPFLFLLKLYTCCMIVSQIFSDQCERSVGHGMKFTTYYYRLRKCYYAKSRKQKKVQVYVLNSCTMGTSSSFRLNVWRKRSVSPDREQEVALLPRSIYWTVVPSATSQTRINFFLKESLHPVCNDGGGVTMLYDLIIWNYFYTSGYFQLNI